MRRTTPLTAAAMLGLALLAPTTAASAAGETCRGEAATIVGERTKVITGTEGRDVVVTNGSGQVDTLGGDDLVCVTGRDGPRGTTYGVSIDTGAGNDVVDGTAARSWGADVTLGAGADRFEGGASDDYVLAGDVVVAGSDVSYPDADPDVLIGGGGGDSLRSGQDGLPNSDVLQGGDGDDGLAYAGTLTDASLLDGGSGVDRLGLALRPGAQLLDNVAGELRRDGALVRRWTSVESFAAGPADVTGVTLEVRGSAVAESLLLFDAMPLTGDLGAGDDSLRVMATLPAVSTLAGGEGRDRFDFGTEDGSVEWDLRSGAVTTDDGSFTARGFEDGFVSAARTRLVGTDGPNDLAANSCDARIDGRDGRDRLSIHSDGTFDVFDTCIGSAVLLGGRGHDTIISRAGSKDRMVGGRGNDTFDAVGSNDTVFGGPGHDGADLGNGNDAFYGGPGRDKVDGQQGRDLCRAERRRSCER
ncbi:calcium-binding protein [Nocardioides baculatus]|uniref:Calcium-binding protein n=1 Tax=Nocardioides baculatus TaxID=2801337 RepID=A0ABS1L3H8_9ACTN|nr:hypothetical protein [Nocardioides baculatus]MBL0746253.1 hypothetical protein [Nocardioides baculatus]